MSIVKEFLKVFVTHFKMLSIFITPFHGPNKESQDYEMYTSWAVQTSVIT